MPRTKPGLFLLGHGSAMWQLRRPCTRRRIPRHRHTTHSICIGGPSRRELNYCGAAFAKTRLAPSSINFPHTLKAEAPSPLHSIVEAPKILLNNPRSRQALTSIWAAIIFTSIFNVALVFFATQSLNTSGFLYAIVAQCFVVGRILGARFSARLTKANALATLIKSGIGMGICISIPGFVPALFLCIPLFALAGMFNGLQVSALRIVVVSAVDPKIKPKALVTMGTINNSAMLVGYIVGAPTVSAAGPNAALIIAGLGTALFTALPSLWNKLTKPFLRSN